MSPTHRFSRILASCCLAGFGIASAQADAVAVGWTQNRIADRAAGVELTAQTMLWQHRGGVALGVGVGQRTQIPQGMGLQPRSADAILVGVSLATSDHSRMSWQTTAADSATTPLANRPMRVSLTFERTDALRHLRRGSLMRLELSGQTTLALRARGGRLGVALTSRW